MNELQEKMQEILRDAVGEIVARAILFSTVKASGLNFEMPRGTDVDRFLNRLSVSLNAHMHDDKSRAQCLNRMRFLLLKAYKTTEVPNAITTLINNEYDILAARKSGQDLCMAAGFPASIQIRVATAISELARNIVKYTKGGEIVVSIKTGDPMSVEVIAKDNGLGINNIEQILNGEYISKTGMGRGLLGVKALMDELRIDTIPGRGTKITAIKKNR
ncbi:MAG: ATP-binding protein [Deltaproteobacteria bacterium]|nr:ATP-binding protein [Deltaproteobacteria bacterium]